MDKDKIIILKKTKYAKDGMNQFVKTGEELTEVFCAVKSISRTEWANTALKGMKASYCVTVWADEYSGETNAVYDGQDYGIYRTYKPNGDEIELYLAEKVGV